MTSETSNTSPDQSKSSDVIAGLQRNDRLMRGAWIGQQQARARGSLSPPPPVNLCGNAVNDDNAWDRRQLMSERTTPTSTDSTRSKSGETATRTSSVDCSMNTRIERYRPLTDRNRENARKPRGRSYRLLSHDQLQH